MAAMPKQLTNQLNMIKKDKETEDLVKKSKNITNNNGKLHSDQIEREERERSNSIEKERWKKVGEAKRVINLKSELSYDRKRKESEDGDQWVKNCDYHGYNDNTNVKSL